MSAMPQFPVAARRTSLAWSRTALAMAVNALLVLRAGLERQDSALLLAAIALGAFSLALAAAGWVRHRELRAAPQVVSPSLMAWTAAGVMLAAAGVLWVVRS